MRESTKAFAAGVIDGDGCLRISHIPSQRRYQSEIVVSGTSLRLSKWLVKHFGGTYLKRVPSNPKHNVWYMWRPSGREHKQKVLSAILPYLRLKKEQGDVLAEFLAIEGVDVDRRKALTQRIGELKKASVETDMPDALSKLGRAYYAGIFDSEGCVVVSQTKSGTGFAYAPAVKIANSERCLLQALQKAYGGNICRLANPLKPCYLWTASKRTTVEQFLLYSLPYLIVKKEQAQVLLDFVRLGNSHNVEVRAVLHQRLKRIKAKTQPELVGDHESEPAETLVS